ncbi:hypothetical protein RBB77_01410 [Tunturibacter psychrotolerans]|uniref:Uncharacterized protein n=1 Tax=Tunturiibacter psychrotolerans TaxID=3069686 RepID=A0AAU7ZRN5_9BACT
MIISKHEATDRHESVAGNCTETSRAPNVYTKGDLEAKAYALTGIRKLSTPRFNELYAALPNANDELATMGGCIVSHKTLRNVAKQLALSPDQKK